MHVAHASAEAGGPITAPWWTGTPSFGGARPPRAWLALVAALALSAAGMVSAAPAARSLAQFHHTRWTIQDGAPGQISAMAQTADGQLWLSAAQSLYRFDGERFTRFEPPGAPITAVMTLHAAPDGALWMAFQGGGVARLAEGRMVRFDGDRSAPTQTTLSMASDRGGTLWAAGRQGLFRYRDGHWQHLDAARWNLPAGRMHNVIVARDGTVWATGQHALLKLPPGASRFTDLGARGGWSLQMQEGPDGRIWLGDMAGSVRPVALADGSPARDAPRVAVESAGLLFARDGSLWITTLGDGLRRLRDPAVDGATPVEAFTQRDGLSADYTWPILQDREGSIWVGSSGGLDRFRPASLVPAPFPSGSHDFALVADAGGALWAGTTNRPLMRLDGERLDFTRLGEAVRCAYRDPHGRIWLGGDRHLWRIEDGRPRQVAVLPEGVVQVQAMALDREGVLWAAFASGGVWRWRYGTWHAASARIGMPAADVVRTMAADREGVLWFGRNDGVLVRLREDVRTFDLARSLGLGAITAVSPGRDGPWIGGQFGLARYDAGRVRRIAIDDAEGLWGVAGIVELDDGDLWVHAVPGIYRLAAAELRRARRDPAYRMRFMRFDFLDGLPARPTLVRPLPTAVKGSDGRLWFATSNGVVWIDPRRIARNPLAPPVMLTGVRADGAALPVEDGLRLPVGVRNLEIGYTALSMAIPQRVRFRYRLEGFDEDWQDVGNRRTAYYGRLPPGDYRFRVIASNDADVWNETGAALSMVVPPAFWQTWWFRSACVLGALGVLAGLYLLRMRSIKRAMQREMELKHGERERIARDLHDTLLQSVQGLVLRFQSVADDIASSGDARAELESVLDRADRVVAEARDRVTELRIPVPEGDLQGLLAGIAGELSTDRPIDVRLVQEGLARPLRPAVLEQALAIGREALFNAFQHSRAVTVEIELVYDGDLFRLRVRDDGVGIDAQTLATGARPGHWGLHGMGERARAIGGRLRLWGAAGAGTEIELAVPGALAYPPGTRTGFWNGLRAAISLGR